MTHLSQASTGELAIKGGNPFAKEFSENNNTMRLILSPVTLASIVGLICGFLSVMALLPAYPRDSIEIRKTEYGDRWPFAIQQGRLDVVGHRLVVRFENTGDDPLTIVGFVVETSGTASSTAHEDARP